MEAEKSKTLISHTCFFPSLDHHDQAVTQRLFLGFKGHETYAVSWQFDAPDDVVDIGRYGAIRVKKFYTSSRKVAWCAAFLEDGSDIARIGISRCRHFLAFARCGIL